jgi:hypothetical protein
MVRYEFQEGYHEKGKAFAASFLAALACHPDKKSNRPMAYVKAPFLD